MLVFSPIFYLHRDRVAALTLETNLPTVSEYAAEYGTLMSYGPELGENMKRAVYYVDRLLKGTQTSELPVEQLSKLKLIVNLRTAKALGVKILEATLVRADEVIR